MIEIEEKRFFPLLKYLIEFQCPYDANLAESRCELAHDYERCSKCWERALGVFNIPCSEDECPRCGADLIAKTGKFGDFTGCSNYPNCRFTRKEK